MDRMKSAAKKAGSAIKSGAKAELRVLSWDMHLVPLNGQHHLLSLNLPRAENVVLKEVLLVLLLAVVPLLHQPLLLLLADLAAAVVPLLGLPEKQ